MSQWNTRQMNSAKFCQLDWILLNSAKTNVSVKIDAWQNSAEFCQLDRLLPSSARFYRSLTEDRARAYTRAHASTTRTPDYLVMSPHVIPFFSLRNVLSFTRAIPLDLDRIYIVPLNLPWSLFVPLHRRTQLLLWGGVMYLSI